MASELLKEANLSLKTIGPGHNRSIKIVQETSSLQGASDGVLATLGDDSHQASSLSYTMEMLPQHGGPLTQLRPLPDANLAIPRRGRQRPIEVKHDHLDSTGDCLEIGPLWKWGGRTQSS